MSKKVKNKYFNKIKADPRKVIVAFWSVTIFLFGFALFSGAAWDPPTANPPSDNKPEPLNATATPQEKAGGLILNSGGAQVGLYVGNGMVTGNVSPGGFLDPGAGSYPVSPPGGALFEGAVGIGTTDPNTNLHITASGITLQGIANADIGFEDGGSLQIGSWSGLGGAPSYNNLCTLDSAGTLDCVGGFTSGGSGAVTGSGTINYVTKWTSSSSIGDSQIFDNGTNVGIGTPGPGAKLHVFDTADSLLRLERSGVSPVEFRVGGGDGVLVVDADGSDTLFLDSGNLGVGGNAPNRLTVHGSASIGTSAPFTTSATGGFTSLALEGRLGIGTMTPQRQLHIISDGILLDNVDGEISVPPTQSIEFGHFDTASGFAPLCTISAAGDLSCAGTITGGGAGDDILWTRSGTNTYLTNSGDNVGIGTSSPAAKLDISGAATESLVKIANSGDNAHTWFNYINGSNYITGDESGGVGDTYFRSWDATNGYTNHMIVKAGGNVGIGTASPAEKLHVNGSVRLSGSAPQIMFQDTTAGNANFWIHNNSDRLYFLPDADENGSWEGPYPLVLWAPSTSDKRVGIGTSSPSRRLHVSGDVGGWTARFSNGNGYIDFGPANTSWAHIYTDRPRFYFNRGANFQGVLSTNDRIEIDGNTVIDNGGGWHRSYGNTGWYNGTYGGGWYMIDTTWVRTYNSKSIYSGSGEIRSASRMRAPIFYDHNNTSYYGNFAGYSRMNQARLNYLSLGAGIDGNHLLFVRGKIRNDQGSNYDVWIQGGSATSGTSRNLALLGVKGSDQLRVNYAGEYTGGTRIDGNVYANGYFYLSDLSQKKNIQPLGSASSLEKILQLNAISFNWVDSDEPGVGFIAQDVEKIFPELVSVDKGNNLKNVNYSALTGPIIEAIKEQQVQIEDLKSDVEELKAQIEAMK